MADRQNRGLRVAMLGQKSVPSRAGGIEVAVEELASRLAEKGCRVTCLNRRMPRDPADHTGKQKNHRGIRLVSVFTVGRGGAAAVSASVSGAVIAALGPYDIVHFHAEGPALMCWLPRLFGKKCIVTIHGLDWKREKWGKLASWYIRLGEKAAARYADQIIVLNEETRRYFEETYGRKTVYIPNGVSSPVIRGARLIREKWGLSKDSYLLFLGRLVPEKGIHYLLEAFRKVPTEKKLVIAGAASQTAAYEKSLKRNGDGRIIFTGFVQGEELEELYSNAYLYCLPSDLEGMPLSLLEAMSYGNCCLVSSISACTSVVEEKAEIFEKGNVEDLRKKLKSLLKDAEKVAAYRQGAAAFIGGKYSWGKAAEQTFSLYGRTAGGRKA